MMDSLTVPGRLRSTAQRTAVLLGAGVATALGVSASVDTAPVTAQQSPVQVCQATGDGTYVLIRVLPDRLEEYRRNPNNIVPAPPAGCPASVGTGSEPAATTTTKPPATTPPPQTTPATPPPDTTPADTTPTKTTPAPRPTTSTAPSLTPAPASDSAVAPATGGGASAPAQRPSYTGTLPADLKRLPNTGNETALLLFLGADLLLLGAGLRLRSRRSSR